MRLTIPSPLLRTNDALRQAGVERPVFVGGAIVELLLTDPASPEPRPTEDVDVTIDVVGRVHFYALEDQLRLQGHKQVTDKGAPMCRWTVHGILVDLMPTDASILGFGNRWYARAVEFAECVTTGESTIHIASAPLFTAMKIDAYSGRGSRDFASSHDIEDIVTLVDGGPELEADVRIAPDDVREHLASTFRSWLDDERFLSALPGHLMPDEARQARREIVLNRMRKIATLGTSSVST